MHYRWVAWQINSNAIHVVQESKDAQNVQFLQIAINANVTIQEELPLVGPILVLIMLLDLISVDNYD
jgi:hypothetical protein